MPKLDPTLRSKSDVSLPSALHQAINTLWDTGKYTLIIIILLTLFSCSMPALQVRAIAMLVTSILPQPEELGYSTIVAVAILSVAIVGSYVSEHIIKYLSDRLTLKLSFETEIQLIHRLQSFEVQDFESPETYDKIQRVDANTGQQIFNLFNSVRSGMQAFISILGIVFVIAEWNIWIAIALIIAPVPAVLATFNIQNKVFHVEYERAPQARLANYFRELLSSDSTKKEIRIFHLGGIFEEKYIGIIRGFLDQDLLLAKLGLTRAGMLGLLSVATNVATIVAASVFAAKTGRAGELAGIITASTQMNTLVMTAFLGIIGSYHHLLYVSNWVALMETKPSKISEGALGSGDSKHEVDCLAGIVVEFRNVSFIYPGTQQTVLNSVSFTIEAGKITALVGQNGSGKTTICKLLLRFYEPTSGSILINGVEISDYSRDSLYKLFSGLFQDFSKFERSIGDNVSYGAGKSFVAENDEINVANTLSRVGLGSLRDDLVDGLNTVLGRSFDGGHQLSIGQWQRLATARALYKKPKLLILDEPTASVDAVSEREIFRALRSVSENLTILLVAHRFTTISQADHIIVLDHGEIISEGSHDQLLVSCDLYKQIYEAQQCGF